VISAAFSEHVLEEKMASDVLELADDHVVVMALKDRIPARIKSLAEVKGQVEAELKQQAVSKQLQARGEALVQRVKAGESVEDVAKQEALEWQVSLDTQRFIGNANSEIRQWAFSMVEPADKPMVDGMVMGNGDYVVIALVKVKEGDLARLEPEKQSMLTATVALTAASRDYQAYETLLLQEADVVSKY
jgi:peptidyl-prolyl cis-trans isomerase D